MLHRCWAEGGRGTGDGRVHFDVTPRAFEIAKVRLHHQCGVETREKVRTQAPADVIVNELEVVEAREFHQCSAESEGARTGD